MRTREFLLLFFILDLCLINSSVLLAKMYYGLPIEFEWPPNLFKILLNVSWVLTYLIFIDDMQYLKKDFVTLLKLLSQRFAVFIAIAAVLIVGFESNHIPRVMFLGSIFIFIFLKLLLSLFLFHRMSLKNSGGSNVVVVGDNKIGHQIFRYCKENPYLGYEPLGILSGDAVPRLNKRIIGTIGDFQSIYDKTPFNVAIISLPVHEHSLISELIHLSEKNGVRPRIVPNWYGTIDRNFVVQSLGSVPLLDIRNVPLYSYPNRFWKRAFDIVVSILLIILLIPVFILVAIAIKLDSKGPVFYKPIRLGVNGKPFTLYKFRSMKESDDAQLGTKSTKADDERITRLGRFLRKSNIDELPQLFNVFMNEMSIVGPRPHRIHLNRNLQQKMSRYMVRHFIKPGITGWAQVNGWRGPTENRLQYMGRTLHDIWYIENWALWLDIYIIFLTVFSRKSRKNAF